MNAARPQAYTIPGVDAMPADRTIPLHLAAVGAKAVALDCDGGRFSSDAGLVLLKDPDEPLGFTRALAAGLNAPRDPRRVDFPQPDLLQQRVWHMAAGYEDAHDSHPLRPAPLCTLLLKRRPETGAPWASQPPLARCEHRVSRTALSRLARVVLAPWVASYDRPPQRIVFDCDDTEAPAQGAQEQVRYEGSDGGSCCLPRHVYAGLSGRLLTTLFKATRCTDAPRLAVVQRLGKRRRHAGPATLLVVRGASPLTSPEVRQGSAAHPDCSSVSGLTSHAVLKELARAVVEQAKRAEERDGGTGTRWHASRSQAGTGSRSRRVVSKVEVSDPGGNPRCVVTDREHARPQVLDRPLDGARGPAANASKAPQRSLHSERTSWHRVEAKQCRVFVHAAASVLLATLRRAV